LDKTSDTTALVEESVHRAVDARAADVQLISDVFDLVASKSLVDEAQFSSLQQTIRSISMEDVDIRHESAVLVLRGA
jgi:hypothetical protein